MLSFSTAICVLLTTVAGTGLCYFLGLGLRPKSYPPGPPTLPIIGNLHQIPSKNEYLQFTKWAKQYGPTYSIMVGSRPIIVLSSAEVVRDLLDKRSAIYSDRPSAYASNHIAISKLRLVFMPYTPLWRKLRKVTHSLLSIKAVKNYDPYQELERKQMLNEMLTSPDDFFLSLQRYTTSLAATLLFGWRASSNKDERIHKLDQELGALQSALGTGAAALLDAFPAIGMLPEAILPIKKRVHRALQIGHKVHMENWHAVKKNMDSGDIGPCLSVGMARAQGEDGITDTEAAYTVGNIFEGGMETTSSTLYVFVQAMVLYPDVRCVKEPIRWFSVGPLGAVPHACTQDDEYMGYKIPKGAPIILNAWAIMTDEGSYAEPRRFNPDRWSELGDDGSVIEMDLSKRETVAFGAGRRICP
ncbi:cytochrome P450, partial [Aureobasidium subglaciale]